MCIRDSVYTGSIALQTKSGKSSIYRKCGILVLSFPGLAKTDCCINSKKNNPNALCAVAPKSPLLVQTIVCLLYTSRCV